MSKGELSTQRGHFLTLAAPSFEDGGVPHDWRCKRKWAQAGTWRQLFGVKAMSNPVWRNTFFNAKSLLMRCDSAESIWRSSSAESGGPIFVAGRVIKPVFDARKGEEGPAWVKVLEQCMGVMEQVGNMTRKSTLTQSVESHFFGNFG